MNTQRTLHGLAVLLVAGVAQATPQEPTRVAPTDREVRLRTDYLAVEAFGLSLGSAAMALRLDLLVEHTTDALAIGRHAPRHWFTITGGAAYTPVAVAFGAREIRFDLGFGRFALVEPLAAIHTRLGATGELLAEIDAAVIENPCLRGHEIFVQAVSLRSCGGTTADAVELSHGLRLSFGRHAIDYDGPPLAAELVSTDSVPPCYALHVSAAVPGLGWRLAHDRTSREATAMRVFLTLTEPSVQAAPAVLPPHPTATSVQLGSDVRAEVVVLVRRKVWGAFYFVEPPYQLAAILRRDC